MHEPPAVGPLSKLGEDVSEVLEYLPARFKVIRHVRPKLSCTKCDVIVQAEAPSRPIERGLAGQVCWRMYSFRNMPTTFRWIARQRSTHEKVSNSNVPR
jgi:hypothetical protein